ncbi:hypothetical protein D3C71_794890 [compost metagenome]
MKQNTFKSLSFSLILLFILSCKKEKGVLDDFDSGRFDFVCIWNKNGVQDTVIGEVSGPDASSPSYYFMVKQELGTINSLKDFKVGNYSQMVNGPFYAPGLLIIHSEVTYEEHDADHLLVHFQSLNTSSDTLNGTFKLTRKE